MVRLLPQVKGNGGTTIRTPTWNPLLARNRVMVPSAILWSTSEIGVINPSCWMLIVG